MFFSIFRPHSTDRCAHFRIKRVNLHLQNNVSRHIYIHMKNPPFNLVVWGSLRLAPNIFRCYEAKLEKSEKAGSHRQSNPGHLWLEPPALHLCFHLVTSKFNYSLPMHINMHSTTHYTAFHSPPLHTNTMHICVSDGKMAQDVGTVWIVVVSFPSSLVGFWGFHPYMCLFSFGRLFVTCLCTDNNIRHRHPKSSLKTSSRLSSGLTTLLVPSPLELWWFYSPVHDRVFENSEEAPSFNFTVTTISWFLPSEIYLRSTTLCGNNDQVIKVLTWRSIHLFVPGLQWIRGSVGHPFWLGLDS